MIKIMIISVSLCASYSGVTPKRRRAGNRKTLHTGKKRRLGSAVLWLLAFPGESSPNFPCRARERENTNTSVQ